MTIKKLLIAGDTHGDPVHWRYLSQVAQEQGADAIFIVGDFGYWEHWDGEAEELDALNEMAELAGVPFYWCDGNHDKTSLAVERYSDTRDDEGFMLVRPWVRYAWRGHRWTWNGIRFIALGGAYSVDKMLRLQLERETSLKRAYLNASRLPENQLNEDTSGMHWFPEEEMTDEEMAEILRYDSSPVDVMLTHDKPRSSAPGWNRKDIPECWPNQDRIQTAMVTLQPKLLVHGHLHYRYTQMVRCGDDDRWTDVLGLNCNSDSQEGAVSRSGMKPGPSSWVLLKLSLPFELPEL